MNAMNRKKTIQRIKKKLKEREKDKENNVKDLTTSHSCDDILHTYSGIPKNDNTLPHSPSKKGTAIDRLVLGLYMLSSEKVQKKYKQKFVELRNNLYNGKEKDKLTIPELDHCKKTCAPIVFGWTDDRDIWVVKDYKHGAGSNLPCLCNAHLKGEKYSTAKNLTTNKAIKLGSACAMYLKHRKWDEIKDLNKKEQGDKNIEDVIERNSTGGYFTTTIQDIDEYSKNVLEFYYANEYEDNPEELRKLLEQERHEKRKEILNKALRSITICNIEGCSNNVDYYINTNRYNKFCKTCNYNKPLCPSRWCSRKRCDYKKHYGKYKKNIFHNGCWKHKTD
jgi:hypothetical protein